MPHVHQHLSIGNLTDVKMCVSGAAETGHCGVDAFEQGKELGREIARQGGTIITGATTGFPLWSAMGAKEEGGFSLGISPARNEEEHVHVYRLPTDYMDVIVYTGFGYSGRDIVFTNSGDAVFFGCGRIGTIHEFTVAYEEEKPIGVLQGDWYTDEVLKMIIEKGNRPNPKIVFDTDPKKLVGKVMELVLKDRKHFMSSYKKFEARPEDVHH